MVKRDDKTLPASAPARQLYAAAAQAAEIGRLIDAVTTTAQAFVEHDGAESQELRLQIFSRLAGVVRTRLDALGARIQDAANSECLERMTGGVIRAGTSMDNWLISIRSVLRDVDAETCSTLLAETYYEAVKRRERAKRKRAKKEAEAAIAQ
jgi:hypothetical protein